MLKAKRGACPRQSSYALAYLIGGRRQWHYGDAVAIGIYAVWRGAGIHDWPLDVM